MNIKNKIISWFCKPQQQHKKNKIAPEKLPQEVMNNVMKEVNFLRSEHSVDVRTITGNEIPLTTKRTDE